MPDRMNAQELADAAGQTSVATRHIERQVRGIMLARVSAGDIEMAAQFILDNDEGASEAARKEFETLSSSLRQTLLVDANEHVRNCLLLAAKMILETAKSMEIDPSHIDPQHVALFAAAPVGWTAMMAEIETGEQT